MSLDEYLFGAPKKGFVIGLIGVILIAIAGIAPAFMLIDTVNNMNFITFFVLFMVGLVMTLFFSLSLGSEPDAKQIQFTPMTLTNQMKVALAGFTGGIFIVLVNAGMGFSGNILLGSISTATVFLVVFAAVAEELFFRGFLQSLFRVIFPTLGPIFAIVPSAVIFGMFHWYSNKEFFTFLILFVVGLGLGIIYETTRDIGAPMLAHAVNNTVSILPVVVTIFAEAVLPLILLVIGVIVFMKIIRLRRG